MPRSRVQPTTAIDNTFFQRAIERYVKGRVTIANPTINDYIEHYGGTTRGVAEKLVDAGEYSNVKSAMRQVQRMVKDPSLKLKPSTIQKLGRLKLPETSVNITISGWYTYDGGDTWKYDEFAPTWIFSASQMRDIISTTERDGNQAGLDKFMDYYGTGIYVQFAEGTIADIRPA